MCRLAAWIGRPLPLSALTHDPVHALVVQARAPKYMREAALNADGWGAAWYPEDGDPRPVRYRVPTPAWSDENLAAIAPRTRSHALMAAVRAATPGMPFGVATNQPFVNGPLAFVHNGYLAPFPEVRPVMRAQLRPEDKATIHGNTDSEHMFALILRRLEGRTDTASVVTAVRESVAFASHEALSRGGRAYLNIMVTNGHSLVAVRCGAPGGGGTLFWTSTATGYEGGVAVASEPLTGDDRWQPVTDDTMMVAHRDGSIEWIPLGITTAREAI